jgi:hypothetical protein
MIGHIGEKATRVPVGKTFYWLKMKQDVEHFVCTCVKWQNTKSIYKKKYGLYRLLLIPNKSLNCFHRFHDPTVWVEWDMDAIFMVVDQFSKLAKMVPTKTIVTTFDLSKLFFDMWVTHHGMSQFIVNDRDIKFTAHF